MHILCYVHNVNNLPLAIRQCPLDLRYIWRALYSHRNYGLTAHINALFSILINICSHASCLMPSVSWSYGNSEQWQVAVSDCEDLANVTEDVIRLCV